MAVSYTGKATIFGLYGTLTSSGITGVANLSKVSGDLSVDQPYEVLRGEYNEPTGACAAEGLMIFDLQFTIQASSIADANAAAVKPTTLAAVTLSNFKAASLNHARWYVVPSTWGLAFANDKVVSYKLQIACSTDAAVNMATTIS